MIQNPCGDRYPCHPQSAYLARLQVSAVTFTVLGLKSKTDGANVEAQLLKAAGVMGAVVDRATGSTHVQFRNRQQSPGQLLSMLEASGYKVSRIVQTDASALRP